MKRLAQGVFAFDVPPLIASCASIVGRKEGQGPLGALFDRVYEDTTLGENSWEKAESRLQKEAVEMAIEKSGMTIADVDFVFSGDLLNQCIASTFGLAPLNIPLIGMFGACSTMASTLISAATFVSSGCGEKCAAVTSSHFCSAERQFRTPLEYGGQRTPTAQWTVTGSGAILLANKASDPIASITAACAGKINDLNISDPTNMGAAMAPAACDTIERVFIALKRTATDYDVIMTGDLGYIGHQLLNELLLRDGIDCAGRLTDGGMLIFDREKQDVHAGGSGCGCSASVLCAYFLPKIKRGEIKRMLFVGTGALMSTTSSFQGSSIPCIAHAVEICSV